MERQKLPNSTAVLVLGILSIVTCCCFLIGGVLGIIGLVLANKATKLYNENPDQYDGFNNVKTGKILCIIGIILTVLYLGYSIMQIMAMGGWDAYIQTIQDAVEQAQQGGY